MSTHPPTSPQIAPYTSPNLIEIDLLVRDGFVLTMDESMTTYYPGSLAIQGDRILAVGPTTEFDTLYRAARVIEASGQVIMPGLVNAHTHIGMGYLRGMADGLKLFDWMTKVTRPTKKFAQEQDNYSHALLGCLELIKGGVTVLADSNDHLPATVNAVSAAGIRGMVSPYVIDLNDAALAPAILNESVQGMERFHNAANGRVKFMFSIHAPYSCSPELMCGVRDLADRHPLGIQIHLAESQDEQNAILLRYGTTPTQLLYNLGILQSDLLAAHFIWVNEQDLELASRARVRVSHNPASNLKLGSGVSPLPSLLEHGMVVGMGTDSCVSNNRLDMFETMKLAALIHNGISLNPLAVSAEQALRMATNLGAQALGMGDEIGTLEPGKKADFILVDMQSPHLVPHFFQVPRNIISHLVYAAQSSDVQLVVVDGRILMEEREVCTLDEEQVMAEAQARAHALLKRAGRL